MKTALILAALALSSCREAKPPAPPPAESDSPQANRPAPPPAAEAPMEPNKAMKYVSGLQEDVKRAQEAKDKADAANKKALEANKLPE